MKTLAIIGSGDLGQQIAHYALSDKHYKAVVFFDDFTNEEKINGCKVLGKTTTITKEFQKGAFDEILIGIGYKHLETKKKIYEELVDDIPFGKIIHSTSWVDPSAAIAPGCVIYPRCDIDAKVVIEANVVLNIGCTIAHDTIIGKHTFLSPRVAIAGFSQVGSQCIIGINSTIIDNITITDKTQIGGGAVVIQNITQSGLYVGNPAKFIR